MSSGESNDPSVAAKRPVLEWVLLAAFVLTFPLVAYVSTLPPQRFRNEITQWGDVNSEAYQQFANYREQFGFNEFVVVSWPGCNLNDTRLEKVTRKIESELDGYIEQISNGQRAYNVLRESVGLSDSIAINRLRNVFVAKDSLSTAVGFNLSEAGRSDRGRVVRKLEEILASTDIDLETVIFAGLGHNLYTMDKEGLESPFRMVPQIMLLAFLLTLFFIRNLWLAFFINALGTYNGCLAFNVVYLADVDMNAIIWPLPTLIMLLTVSASLHFLGYYRKAVEQSSSGIAPGDFSWSDRRGFSWQALRFAIKPILYCTLTTAIGLVSLSLSTSEPVRQFGILGAISIVAANTLMLVWLPAFLTLVRYANRIANKSKDDTAIGESRNWNRLTALTTRFRWVIVIGSVLLIAWSATGIVKIQTGSGLENFFPSGHAVLNDTRAIEQATGPLNSVELLLRFSDHDPANDRLRLRGIGRLCSRITKETPFAACVSPATFAPRFTSKPSAVQLSVETTRVNAVKDRMVENSMLHVHQNKNEETWRVSCRYSTLQYIDLPAATKQLQELVDELFYRDGELLFKGEQLTASTTGEFVLFDYIDQQFFRELLNTYATAFGIIMLIVIVVLAKPSAILAGLLPNLFPAVVVLGITGHLGYMLDVASLMTASVALGIAVDDTLHFLLWHRDLPRATTNPIASTMRYCGTAILQTSLILGCSIVLYAFCGFLPTVRFGILLSAMMLSALAGDLILLPALLSFVSKRSN